jgi:hypothetical protein
MKISSVFLLLLCLLVLLADANFIHLQNQLSRIGSSRILLDSSSMEYQTTEYSGDQEQVEYSTTTEYSGASVVDEDDVELVDEVELFFETDDSE